MFDPYHKWLGIPPKDQPPNHYRLLALELFESDPEVIDAAANRQMGYIQQRATGKHTALSQKLLNELASARLCLLESQQRAAYDAELRDALSKAVPTAKPKRRSLRRAAPDTSDPFAFLQSTGHSEERGRTAETNIGTQRSTKRPAGQRAHPRSPQQLRVVLFAVGGCLALAVLVTLYAVLSWDNTPNAISRTGKSHGVAKPNEKKPPSEEPARYNVEVGPPFANLVIKSGQGIITGEGARRQLQIDHLPSDGIVVLEASCNGYESSEQQLVPRPGDNGSVWFILREVSVPPITPANPGGDDVVGRREVPVPPITPANPDVSVGVVLKKIVSLSTPYPQLYRGAETDKITVQYAVMALVKQVGLYYDFDTSRKNTDPICRQWIWPNIHNQPCDVALNSILEPLGLSYEVSGRSVTLKRIPAAAVQPQPEVKPKAVDPVVAAPQKTVSLAAPYPQSYSGARKDKISVQNAVKALVEQVGLHYDFKNSFKNTNPICRQLIQPNIQNQPFDDAIKVILGPIGLAYDVSNGNLVLKRTAAASQKGTTGSARKKTAEAAMTPTTIVEGVGFGPFHVGASQDDLIKALGPPDAGSDGRWLQWRSRHHVHCIVDNQRGAVELRFEPPFAFPLTTGIRFGSSESDVRSAYGEPTHVLERGGGKKLEYDARGVLFWFTNGRVIQIVVFQAAAQGK